MRERQRRLKAIRQIIQKHRVDSQETLLQILDQQGFHVTQATLSRDLKFLRVGKQAYGEEGFFYSLPSAEIEREREQNFARDFQRGFVSIDFTGQLAIIRTINGHADAVALAIDSLHIEAVMGTVAGDDTVFVALREEISREDFLAALQAKVPDLEE